MKYWWILKYKNFKIVDINKLSNDVSYFITVPKNYYKKLNLIKSKELDNLSEEELLILLYDIVNTKSIKDNTLNIIISKLLSIPDNSFPATDYTISDIFEEVINLKNNLPLKEKLDSNNICVCYNCLNVFYVDKINSVNKNNLCLCPYCNSHKLYFDMDYIPMNYSFIKFANIYYKTSLLGCTYREISKILKKNVKVVLKDKSMKYKPNKTFNKKRVTPIDEKKYIYELYNYFKEFDNDSKYDSYIYFKDIESDIDLKILITLIAIIDVLSNSLYLKNVVIVVKNVEIYNEFKKIIKLISYM